MPAGFGNTGLQTAFAYVTIEQVRAEGFPDTIIPDDRLRKLIRMVSHWINRLTHQWFLPIRLRAKVDGARGSVAHLPNMIPILDLFSLRFFKDGLIDLELPDVAYQVKPRYVMMMTHTMRLPTIPHFVILDGVFGWLVDDFTKTQVRTVAPLVVTMADVTGIPDPKEVLVNSVDGIYAGDAILIGSEPEPLSYPAIVTGVVTTAPLKIIFEPVVPFSMPTGTKITRYGRVPDRIQQAMMMLIRDMIQGGYGQTGSYDTSESPGGIGTRLNSESVEGYSYSLSPLKAINSPGGGAITTGNATVDDILTEFTADAGGIFIGYA